MAELGRPSKISADIENQIAQAIRSGNYIETAAALAGINKSTLYEWLKRGERAQQDAERTGRKAPKKEHAYISFSNAIKKALAQSESADVGRISRAARLDWHAAAWRLERKFPERWGRKHQVYETDEERDLRLLKLRMEIEINRKELESLTGGGADPHEQILAYTNALKGQVPDIFKDMQPDEGEQHGDS